MSKIFIDRPIFAWVIAIIIMLMGIGAIVSLIVLSRVQDRQLARAGAAPIPGPP